MGQSEPGAGGGKSQVELYQQSSADYGAALSRLARAYEADPDKRRDLLQEVHLALWRSFARFDGRCSLRTWVYRVAHNVANSHVTKQLRSGSHNLVSLEEAENMPDPRMSNAAEDQRRSLDRLLGLIQQLEPLERQVIVSYLEELDANSIAEITGLSPGNVATKVHRIKNILSRRFRGGPHGA